MTQNQFQNSSLAQPSSKSFITPTWQQHADMVSHLGQFSQNILLVIAPLGGGKTTFLDHFVSHSTNALRKCVVNANVETMEDLLKAIMEGFELPWMGIDAAYDQIQDHVEDSYVKDETTWMLLIDDAHLLSDEKLKSVLELVQFQSSPKKQLHLVFLGEASLELRLFSPDVASCIHGKIYTIELESWTLNDIRTFFAKEANMPRLDTEQLKQIFERSRGLPAQVLREKEAILETNVVKTKKMSGTLKKWHHRPVVMGVFIGLVAGGGYLMFNGTLEEEGASLPSNLAQLSDNDWEMQHITPQQSSHSAYQFDNMDAEVFDEKASRMVSAAYNAIPGTDKNDKAERHELANSTKVQNVAVAPKAVVEQTTPTTAEKTAKNPQTVIAAKQTPVKIEPKTIMAKSLKHEPLKQDINRRLTSEEELLLAVKDDHYTLQLLGARSEESVKQFIQAHDIADSTHYFKTKLSGKDWYVVVYGDYYSKAEALSAIDSMPSSLRDQSAQPWVRELKSIQKDIRK